MVYAREHDDGVHTFIHSGKLWHDALVLQDRQTGSLWSQATGQAIAGPLEGERLRAIPSEIVAWGDWVAEHPETAVLLGETDRRKLKLRLYPKTHRVLGILGTKNPDGRLPGKTSVVGFSNGPESSALALPDSPGLHTIRVVALGTPWIVEHRSPGGPTRLWRSDGEPHWNRLERRPADVMYWFVWSGIHPDSRIVAPHGRRTEP